MSEGYRCPYCGDECPHIEAFFAEFNRRQRDLKRSMAKHMLPIAQKWRDDIAHLANLNPGLIENADMEIWRLETEQDSEE